MHQLNPIGIFYCESRERYSQPHQPQREQAKTGTIELMPNQNFEVAIEDLLGFEKIWLIFQFHKAEHWKPKVMPPRNDGFKKGVFSTRSPHRPNRLGLSVVDLVDIEGLSVHVLNHDLLDGTPIYDIKPYLPYCDAHPQARQGWTQAVSDEAYSISWCDRAHVQHLWLLHKGIDLQPLIETTLSLYPKLNAKRRIRSIVREGESNCLELAVKTWRLVYQLDEVNQEVSIIEIYSGYDHASLAGERESKWDDLPLHRDYMKVFYV